jgi:F0F1-type ATP synthase alpha subunit
MQLNPSEISELIRAKIQNLDTGATVRTQGTVVSIPTASRASMGCPTRWRAKCSSSPATRSALR